MWCLLIQYRSKKYVDDQKERCEELDDVISEIEKTKKDGDMEKTKKIFVENYSSEQQSWIDEYASLEQREYMQDMQSMIISDFFHPDR